MVTGPRSSQEDGEFMKEWVSLFLVQQSFNSKNLCGRFSVYKSQIYDYSNFIFSGPEELGSGNYGHRYITDSGIGDDDGIDIDDSDYDIYIDEVNPKASLWHFGSRCFYCSI